MIIKTPPKLTNRSSLIKYIEIDLWSWLRDLCNGTLRFDFKQNFQSFTVENLLIPAGIEVSIPNGFKRVYQNVIPSSRIIVRQQGDANIIDGQTQWSENHVYLLNPSANDATITVIFFK